MWWRTRPKCRMFTPQEWKYTDKFKPEIWGGGMAARREARAGITSDTRRCVARSTSMFLSTASGSKFEKEDRASVINTVHHIRVVVVVVEKGNELMKAERDEQIIPNTSAKHAKIITHQTTEALAQDS